MMRSQYFFERSVHPTGHSTGASSSRRMPWTHLGWPVLIATLGLLATVIATGATWTSVERTDQERFLRGVEQTQAAMLDRMETYIAVIRSTAALFAASEEVTRAEFKAFVTKLTLGERYPGIQGIGYSVHVPPGQVKQIEAEMRAQGAEGFRIWPDTPRDEINTIIYLEPFDRRNKVAVGYDMSVDPVRRAAMERARDTGEPASSGKVRLVQEIDRQAQAGFLIYVPVYRNGAVPATVEERRRRFLGHAYAPFRADDLLGKLLGGETRPYLALEVHDGEPDTGTLMHRSGDWSAFSDVRYRTERSLEVAGRHWTTVYIAGPGLEATSGRWLVSVVAVGGLLATAMLLVAAWFQSRARAEAERASAAELLRAQELEIINAVGAEVSAQLDLDRLVQSITDAATRVSGAQVGAFFYNVHDERGESYMLHALSGANPRLFAGYSMPRNTELFAPTFRGEAPVRSDDITKDPRYGRNAPHGGMPPGHPMVRSYLAVPVVSRSGETLGGLLLGHGKPGVFTIRAERLVAGLAAQAAVAVDNARLFGAVQKEAERRKLLLDELNHRVKNTLAAVQSIARQTSRSAPTPEAFAASFEGRLFALSHTHDLLTRGNWENAPLAELARSELAPYGQSRAVVKGPAVLLPPQDAVAIGMAFHELATNAAKYGALSTAGGHVRVGWSIAPINGKPWLKIVWEEAGGPPVAAPTRQGFGTRLLGGGLANQLDGMVTLDFPVGGLRCVIEFPLVTGAAAGAGAGMETRLAAGAVA
ncbi:CHASE1-domain containing sensor protein/two-component sensor histidine kinase [Skermanella aerolata]|uniref:CHASE domain-containing protein n=1 Tax=Skermanella aerolata TaxID=393310 RepID=UPI003D2540FC